MTDLTQLSNDQFAQHGVAFFTELHRRLEPTGYIRLKERAHFAHEGCDRIAKRLADDGVIQPLSGGEGKEP